MNLNLLIGQITLFLLALAALALGRLYRGRSCSPEEHFHRTRRKPLDRQDTL